MRFLAIISLVSASAMNVGAAIRGGPLSVPDLIQSGQQLALMAIACALLIRKP